MRWGHQLGVRIIEAQLYTIVRCSIYHHKPTSPYVAMETFGYVVAVYQHNFLDNGHSSWHLLMPLSMFCEDV